MINDPSHRKSPTKNSLASNCDGPMIASTPIAHRAARISCYGSLAVYVVGAATTLSPLLWELVLIIDVAAFALGVVGIVGGINRGAIATIRMGTFGALLSGIPLALIILNSIATRLGPT
jgi:hypothetical protein